MGCWTPVERYAHAAGSGVDWHAQLEDADGSAFTVVHGGRSVGRVEWSLLGMHNVENALASIAAAHHAGVETSVAIAALKQFAGVRRRMEIRGVVGGITVYDDFAHHPTAITTTIDGLRRKVGSARILAVLEPRSNTMKLGTHRDALAQSLNGADSVWLYQGPDVKWDVATLTSAIAKPARAVTSIDALVAALDAEAQPGDHILIMSNGGFGGVHGKLLERLRQSRK
jgi:UDP-N-acetylmuramate: L-alanyl-gamma-D-glutamyl-meso-diaminopimelate ligase